MVKVKEDMTGWNMWEHGYPNSRLTVMQQAEDYVDPKGRHHAQWLCVCNCAEHNQIIARHEQVKHGRIMSCGCIRKEILAETRKTSRRQMN